MQKILSVDLRRHETICHITKEANASFQSFRKEQDNKYFLQREQQKKKKKKRKLLSTGNSWLSTVAKLIEVINQGGHVMPNYGAIGGN